MMKRKQSILVRASMKRGFEHKVVEYNSEILLNTGVIIVG